jgi:alkylation response protein AidB-like acyl-CoA dehydrogenase
MSTETGKQMTATSSISRAERDELHDAVRSFFDRTHSEAQTRTLIEGDLGYDPAVWSRLGNELALPGVLIPESLGGQGFSPAEAVLGLEEAGRTLSGLPLLSSSVLATWALLQADDVLAAGGLLAELAAGRTIAAIGLDAARDNPPIALPGVGESEGWTLDGVVTNVIGGHLADTVLVVALVYGHGEGEVSTGLFAVSAGTPGLEVEVLPGLDLTRPLARITMSSVPARRIGTDFADAAASTRNFAAIAACAELLGIAERCLELGVEYAKTREQFGQLIGSFQAVKHLLADALANVEQMRGAVATAAAAITETPEELDELASVVKAFCSDAGPRTAETLIQVLGGIGFTWEHVAHLYLRRAKTLEFLFGDAAFHRDRLARRLGLAS